jgi:hypothetical protein
MDVPVMIRISRELHDALDAAADAAGMTRTAFWAKLLADGIGKPELAKKPKRSLLDRRATAEAS